MLSVYDSIGRLLLAALFGGVIGLERETHGRAAGFRTHALVCVGSALFTLMSFHVFQAYGNQASGDPARIAYGVVVGMGFLGGGTIVRSGSRVHGLTTAAALWSTAAIGLAVGAGQYLLSAVAAGLVLVVLLALRVVEQWVGKDVYRTLVIHTARWREALALLDDELPARGMRPLDCAVSIDEPGNARIRIRLRWRSKEMDTDLIERLRRFEGTKQVEWS